MNEDLKKLHDEGMKKLIDSNRKMHPYIVDNPHAKPEHIEHVYRKHDEPSSFMKSSFATNWKTPVSVLRDLHSKNASNYFVNKDLVRNIHLPGDVLDYIDRHHGTKVGNDEHYMDEQRITRMVSEHPNIRLDTAENILSRHGTTKEQINNRDNLRIINNLHGNRNLPQEFRDKIKTLYKQNYEPNYTRFGPKNDPNELK